MVGMALKNIDYKVEGGKLLRLEIDIDNGVIIQIKITGDFFMHPEESIILIEEALKGINVENVAHVVRNVIISRDIKVIGFTAEDLEKAIVQVSL